MFDKSAELFPSKKNGIFLGHCAVSPLFSRSADFMQGYAQSLQEKGVAALSHYVDVLPVFHQGMATLLKTGAENISYVHNTAEGMSMIANGYPFSPGDQIISYCHEYPSNHYPWLLQRERGVELILLGDATDLKGLENEKRPKGWSMAELEQSVTDRTRIIAISHVQFTSGYTADLRELGEFCMERNIDFIVDCSQSLGCLPIYPEEWNISALTSSGWKWLMGPKGSAVMYTSESFRDKVSITMSGPSMMTQGLNYLDLDWKPYGDGRKFEFSTLPWDHVGAMNALLKGIFQQYSIEDIRNEVFRLQELLLDNLDRSLMHILEFESVNRSGIVAASITADSRKVIQDLAGENVVITAPVGYLRLAPHFYNDDEQIIKAAGIINRCLHSHCD